MLNFKCFIQAQNFGPPSGYVPPSPPVYQPTPPPYIPPPPTYRPPPVYQPTPPPYNPPPPTYRPPPVYQPTPPPYNPPPPTYRPPPVYQPTPPPYNPPPPVYWPTPPPYYPPPVYTPPPYGEWFLMLVPPFKTHIASILGSPPGGYVPSNDDVQVSNTGALHFSAYSHFAFVKEPYSKSLTVEDLESESVLFQLQVSSFFHPELTQTNSTYLQPCLTSL